MMKELKYKALIFFGSIFLGWIIFLFCVFYYAATRPDPAEEHQRYMEEKRKQDSLEVARNPTKVKDIQIINIHRETIKK